MDNTVPLTISDKPTSSVKPVSTADRIRSIDMVRGVALLGILLMNIPGFGIDFSEMVAIGRGPEAGKDYVAMAAMFAFFDGTMRGLFSMLFGAGMVLFMMNKKDSPGGIPVAEYYFRRLLWLVAFGLFNAFILLWPGDILYFYGLSGMLLFVFRNAKPRWLLLIGVGCIAVGMFKAQFNWNEIREKRSGYTAAIAAEKKNQPLTEEQEAAKAQWLEVEKRHSPDTVEVNRNLQKMHSGYATIFQFFIPFNTTGETWGMYDGIWDFLCMMFIGMALFKLGFFSNKLSNSTYAMCLLLAYGIGIPIGWEYFHTGVLGSIRGNYGQFVDAWRTPFWALYDIRRVLLSVGHASLLMLIFRSRILPWLMRALANVGQMAFTNYLMQTIICTLIFYGYGFSKYNTLRFHQLYYVAAAIWLFQLIFSSIWLRYFRFGPFEWLWRSLTYWKKQPMKV